MAVLRGLLGNLGFRQSDLGKLQAELTQSTQLQAGVWTLCGSEGHCESVVTGSHMVDITAVAGHLFIGSELDIALCIGGKDIDRFVGLSCFQSEVVLQLHLPPVTGGIGGSQDHGGCGILPDQGCHGGFRPGLVVFKAIGDDFRSLDLLQGPIGEHQGKGSEPAQLQAAVRIAGVPEADREGIFAYRHIIFIGTEVSRPVIDKLDSAGGITGEGECQVIPLSRLAVDVLFHLDLPPIGLLVGRGQGHGGCGIAAAQALHGAVGPDPEAVEALGGCRGDRRQILRIVDFDYRDIRKQQLAGAQAAQFQAAVAVAACLELHGEFIFTLLYIVLIGAIVGRIVVDELNPPFGIAGKAEGNPVIAALRCGQVLLQLHLPPVGGRIGIDQLQALRGLGACRGNQRSLAPHVHAGEGILRQQPLCFFRICFPEVNVSKGKGHIRAVTQLTQLQAGALRYIFIRCEIEGSNAKVAVYPLGFGADHGRRTVIDGIGYILGSAAGFGEYEGGLISLSLHQGAVNCQLDPPAFLCMEGCRQMPLRGGFHGSAGLFRGHVQEIGGQIFLQRFTGNGGNGKDKLVQTAQLQAGVYLAVFGLARGKAYGDLIFTGLYFILVGPIVGRAVADKADRTGSAAGKAVDELVKLSVNSLDLLVQPNPLHVARSVFGGEGHAGLAVLPDYRGQGSIRLKGKAFQAVGLAALADTLHEGVAVGLGLRGRIGLCRLRDLLTAACQNKQVRQQQQHSDPSDRFGCLVFTHKNPS